MDLQKWNKIFEIICLMAVSVDPLFFYILVIDAKGKCLKLDRPLQITASVLRTFFDMLYILYIMSQFQTRYRVLGMVFDILLIIPLPQVIVLAINPSIVAKEWLKYIVLIQYVPRFLRINPLFRERTQTSRISNGTAWTSAAYNLFFYMLSSHIVGAFWYLFSVESQLRCWHQELKKANLSAYIYLSCGQHNSIIVFKILNGSCPLVDPDDIKDLSEFNFGIFIDALKSHVVKSNTGFPQKFFYCFGWGLRSVSSLGQNLKTSTYVGETIFAVFIAIFGFVLFSLLIGNMQQYLQSLEEMRMKTHKRKELQQWMSRRKLPNWLRYRIIQYEYNSKKQENRGVEEEAIIQNLPKDLRMNVMRYLRLDLLKKVPMFEKIDEKLLYALFARMKPVLYTENRFIIGEGDPIDEMLFIMRGNLATMTTNGGTTGFFNTFMMKAGDFCGEELLGWALDPNSSSSNLPISTITVESISEVEGFALMADDLKFVVSQFHYLNNQHIQHAFKYYSLQWRTWAACFIQVAWRCYCRRKIEKSLCEIEDRPQDALANDERSPLSLGATIYASRFAANALRSLQNNGEHSN